MYRWTLATVEKLRAKPGARNKQRERCVPPPEDVEKFVNIIHERSRQICREDNRLRLTTPDVHKALYEITGLRMPNYTEVDIDEEDDPSRSAKAQRARTDIVKRLRVLKKKRAAQKRLALRRAQSENIPLRSGFPHPPQPTEAAGSPMSEATSKSNNTVEMKSLESPQDEGRILTSNSSGMSVDTTPKTGGTESMSVSSSVGDDPNKGHASDEDRRADETLYGVDGDDFDTEPDSIPSSSRKLSLDAMMNLPDLPEDRRDSVPDLNLLLMATPVVSDPVPAATGARPRSSAAAAAAAPANACAVPSTSKCNVSVVAERLAKTAIDTSKKRAPKKSTLKSGTSSVASPLRKTFRTDAEPTSQKEILAPKTEEQKSPKHHLKRSGTPDNEAGSQPKQPPTPPRKRLVAKRFNTMECETPSPAAIPVKPPAQSPPGPKTPEPRAPASPDRKPSTSQSPAPGPRVPDSPDRKPSTPQAQSPTQADAGDIPALRRSSPRVTGRRPILSSTTSPPTKAPESPDSTKPEQPERPKSN